MVRPAEFAAATMTVKTATADQFADQVVVVTTTTTTSTRGVALANQRRGRSRSRRTRGRARRTADTKATIESAPAVAATSASRRLPRSSSAIATAAKPVATITYRT